MDATPGGGRTRRAENRQPASRTEAQERWQQILEASTDLFRRKGFASTSMQDISDAVGLLKGSLYYYIDSKEDLLFRILQGLHQDGEEIIASIDFTSDDPVGQLRIYLKKAVMFAGNNAERLAIFLRDFHNVPEERRREIISEREMYRTTVRRLIEQVKAKGLTDPDLDVSLASTLVSGAVSSTHEWLRPHGRRPIEAAAEEVAEMLTRAVLKPAASRRAAADPVVKRKAPSPRRKKT